jgi:hypothetical protein
MVTTETTALDKVNLEDLVAEPQVNLVESADPVLLVKEVTATELAEFVAVIFGLEEAEALLETQLTKTEPTELHLLLLDLLSPTQVVEVEVETVAELLLEVLEAA